MDSLLTIGVSNAAAVAVLSVLLIPLARWLRRPALTHAVCVLLLLKLVTPPVFTLPLHWLPSAPAAGRTETPVATVAVTAEPSPARKEVTVPAGRDDLSDITDSAPIDDSEVVVPVPSPAIAPAPPIPFRVTPPPPPFRWSRALAAAWLAAAVLCAALIAVRLRQLRRFLRSAVIAPPDVQAHARVLAARLGLSRPPPVLFVPGRPCPMLLAVFTAPRLLVPRQLWDRLDPDQRQTLLLHELAHLRRRDHWVRCLELLVTVLYWWHPSAWWARVTLREAEEQCCDAWVVWAMPGAVRTYMATLLDAVDFLCEPADVSAAGRSPSRPVIPATPMLASGMGQFHCLERRLTMVKYQAVRRCLSRRGFAAVVGVAALLPLTPTLAQQQEPSTTPPVRSVAPVPVAADPAKPIPASAADDSSSARNDKADTTPVPASAAEPAQTSNGSRDDEVVRLRKELQDMRAKLRDYEQQLRAARAERGERTERGTRETRTAAAPENANSQENGKNYRTGTAVPAPPTSSNGAPPPAGEVRTVTRDGVTYRELYANAAPANQPGQIVVRSEDGQVQGFDRDTGKVVWVFRMDKDANVTGVNVERGVASVRLSDGGTLRLDLPTGKVVDRPATAGVGRGQAGPDQEQRLKALEDKLDRLMKEVQRHNQNRNEDRESKPGTSQGPGKS